jgi:hypothetical protein
MKNSLNKNIQFKQDSLPIKQSDSNNSILTSVNNISSSTKNLITDSIVRQTEIKNFDLRQTYLKSKIDTSNKPLYLKAYSFEPWYKLISVNSKIYKSINKQKEIYCINENSTLKSTPKLIQEYPVYNKENTAIGNTVLLLIIISFALLAWVKISFGKYLNQLLRALINYSDEAKLYNDHNTIIDRLYLLLNSIFTITGALFIYYFLKYTGKEYSLINPFLYLFYCICFIIVIYVYRYVVNKIFGFVFYQKQVFNEYLHSAFLYYKAMGLFLLPLIFVVYIIPEKYRFGIFVVGSLIIFVLYFISVFKATRIMLQKGILLFYWILYLCTVEFLPIILICKFLSIKG